MDYHFDFDDQLPDLPTAFDLEAVGELFSSHWPGYAEVSGMPGAIHASQIQDIKYKPAAICILTYELEVERPGLAPWQTIGVVEVRPQGISHRLFDTDPKLPWLAAAINPEGMRARFAALLAAKGQPGEIEKFQVTTVRYKPGNHCVFRYDLSTSSGAQVYYGKLLSEDGDRLTEILAVLHEASLVSPELPRIPKPLAYWPELKLLIQPQVEGVELRKFAFESWQEMTEREYWMGAAGAATAGLHASGIPGGKLRTFEEELDSLHEYSAMIAKVHPRLAARFEGTIQEIAASASGLVEPPALSSHGALRTDQFFIQGNQLVMIDMDSYCWSNPARDLGNFLAYMCWKAIRQPEHGAFVERAGQAFLDGYLAAGGLVDDRWLAFYQAASLLKIAGRRFRSLTFREWPLVAYLLDAAAASILTLREVQGDHLEKPMSDMRHRQILHLTTATSSTKFPATFIDTEFPALWYALNTEMMDDNLSPLLQPVGCKGEAPVICNVKLLAYKPGKRGVLRYEADIEKCAEDRVVLGKLYPSPNLANRAYHVMKALNDEVFAGMTGLGVSCPLGVISELSMLVFLPAEGRLLGDVISDHPKADPRTIQIMDMASTWLATLHAHRLPLEKRFEVAAEKENFREWVNIITARFPEEAKAAELIAGYLLERADELPFVTETPIHKDFHYEHILIDGGLKVIDFDEIRLGDPNLDLAHFCANFFLLAYRKRSHPVQFARLQGRFLDTYAGLNQWKLDERFVYFYAYSCLKLAKQICKKRGPRPWPEGEEMRGQVWLMLEQGLTTLFHMRINGLAGEFPLPILDFSKNRRTTWLKATRISKSVTSSEVIRVSHRLLS